MMIKKPSSTKLSGPNRRFEASSGSGALRECPEMSANVRDSEISGLTLRRVVSIWSKRRSGK